MTKVKICGIRTVRDALAAAQAGTDMLGFNFHPKSIRYIDGEACARVAAVVRQEYPSVQLVGIFVNAAPDEVLRTLTDCGLDLAQLSGDEPPEACAVLRGKAFKAFHGVPSKNAERYARSAAPAFLVDSRAGGAYGGTGVLADWNAAAKLSKGYPLLLAGGLKADNVAEAIEQVNPWGVDVASGVESEPGTKDVNKIRAFIEAVRFAEVHI